MTIPEGFKETTDGKLTVHCKKCDDIIKTVKKDTVAEMRNPRMYFPTLCKECLHEDPYVKREEFDGAKIISYPPTNLFGSRKQHSLTTYRAYEDCDECEGKGRIRVHRTTPGGGSYHKYCEKCGDRYRNHPLRVAKNNMLDKIKSEIDDKYNELFYNKLRHHGYDPDKTEKIREDEEYVRENIAQSLVDKRKKKIKEARRRVEEHYEEALKILPNSTVERAVQHINHASYGFSVIDKPNYEHDIPENTQQKTLFEVA